MALKALMLRKKIDSKKTALTNLREKDNNFEKREADLEKSIEEAATEEETAAVEEAISEFNDEKAAHDETKANLEKEIDDLEKELEEVEAAAPQESKPEERKKGEIKVMNTRTKFFGMSIQERDAFMGREDVKTFISEVRSRMTEKRAITNVGLLIPEVTLDLLKQVVERTSKLYGKVNTRFVAGKARQNIMGEVPEAVWTEMCAKLNELSLGFNNVEVDGYKVGGYFAVCNATLEDNDVNLMTEIIEALGVSIAKAYDKAIVYGTGVKMPLGFVTRLAQTTAPEDYPVTYRPWVDLHTSNIKKFNSTGIALFKDIVIASGMAKSDYAKSGLIWIMNKATHTKILAESMGQESIGAAIVAGVNNTMPVVGGEIIELEFMSDGDIAFGYGEAYLLAERAGTEIAVSEHARFIEDQTVFKGTARADGEPVIAEAFGLININNVVPTTTKTFASDLANA